MPPLETRRSFTSEKTGASSATGAIDSCSCVGWALITSPVGFTTRTQFRVSRSRPLTYENDCSPQFSAASRVKICTTCRYVRLPRPSASRRTTPSSSRYT